MDQCDKRLDQYISLSDHEERTRKRLAENSEYYQKILKQKDRESFEARDLLIKRYTRADMFLDVLMERTLVNASKKSITLETKWVKARDDLKNPENPIIKEIDILLQMGLDFELLLNAIKNDETLANQWRNILMIMRLSGYDSFDSEKED